MSGRKKRARERQKEPAKIIGDDPARFDEAVSAWRRRQVLVPDPEFRALDAAARERSVWVAGVADASVLQDVFDGIDRALRDGTTLEDFKAEVGPALEEAWGGENAPRLENVFRTNIMCVLPGQVVEGRVLSASKARYAGQVVQLRTKAGRRLTVTPNHPILTAKGFAPAHSLRHGDHVLHGTRHVEAGVPSDRIQKNVEQRPALIEDVFRSLGGDAGRSVRRRLGPLDLHGDAMMADGEIHIVRTDRKLLRDLHANVLQGIGQFLFALSDIVQALESRLGRPDLGFQRDALAAAGIPCPSERGGGMRGSFFRRERLPLSLPGLGMGSPLQSDGFEKSIDLPGRKPGSLGQVGYRLASAIALLQKVSDVGGQGHPQAARFGPTAQLDPGLGESERESGRAQADLFSKLLHGNPGQIAADQIVDVGNGFFRGHVYDLQTEGGWYLSQQLCISNCAYNAGRHDAQNDPETKRDFPYLRFDSSNDSAVCSRCRPLNGVIKHIDDPFWATRNPPLHYMCRCIRNAISEEDAKAEGVTGEAPKHDPPLEGFGGNPTPGGSLPDLGQFDPALRSALQARLRE